MIRNIIVIFLLLGAFLIFWSGTRPLWQEVKIIKEEERLFKDFLQKI